MNKNYFQKGMLAAFTLSLLTSTAQGGRYADIFTHEIYKQKTILANLKNATDEERDEALIKNLREKKKELLEKNCIKEINNTIDFLKNEIKSPENNDLYKTLKKMDENSFKEKIGNVIAEGIRPITFGIFDPLLTTRTNALSPSSIYIGTFESIQKLKTKIVELYNHLESEPIHEIEEKYIKQRRNTPKELRKEIEKVLLNSRKTDYLSSMLDQSDQFLEFALQLPLFSKPALDVNNLDESRRALLDTIRENELFKNYDDATRKIIENMIMQAANDSVSNDSKAAGKKAYYLWGDPSSGKTTAATEIPKLLGLPYYEITPRSVENFQQANMEGASRITQNPSPGWLAEALMQTNSKNNQAYTSGFLIINDLDRILNDPASATTTLASLLHLLDPQTKSFYSPYFKSNIDISRLIIIITANKKMEDNDFYNALGTRLFGNFYFPKFSSLVTKKILENLLADQKKRFTIPELFSFEYDNSMDEHHKIRVTCDDRFLENYQLHEVEILTQEMNTELEEDNERLAELTLRALKSRSEWTINKFKSFLLDTANYYFVQSSNFDKNTQEKKYFLKAAAFLGDARAYLKLAATFEADRELNLAERWYQRWLEQEFGLIQLPENLNELLSENQKVNSLRLIDNPGDLNQIQPGELGLFCENEKLYCKISTKEKMEIIKSDASVIGIASEIYDRIFSTLQENINPVYLQAGLVQEEEGNKGGAYRFYNQAFENITISDQEALLQYIATQGYTHLNELSEAQESIPLLGQRVKDHDTSFHLAVRKGKIQALKDLLELYPDGIDLQGDNGNTPIMLAASLENLDIVKLLHEKGANKTILNNDKCSALQIAQIEYRKNPKNITHKEIFRFLLENSPENSPELMIYSENNDLFLQQIEETIIGEGSPKYLNAVNTLGKLYYQKAPEKAYFFFKKAKELGYPLEAINDPENYHLCLLKDGGKNVQILTDKDIWKDYYPVLGEDIGPDKVAAPQGDVIKQNEVFFKGKVYSSSVENQRVCLSLNGKGKIKPNPNWRTDNDISLASFKEKLYLAHIGTDSSVYISSSEDGENWAEAHKIIEALGIYHIDLISLKDALILGVHGRLWGRHYSGNVHSVPISESGRYYLNHSNVIMPSIGFDSVKFTVFKGGLYFTGEKDGKFYHKVSQDGYDWPDEYAVSSCGTNQFWLKPLFVPQNLKAVDVSKLSYAEKKEGCVLF